MVFLSCEDWGRVCPSGGFVLRGIAAAINLRGIAETMKAGINPVAAQYEVVRCNN
jgi:hypothetical protein